MELLLAGVVAQVVFLRLLAVQLARSPDDPPLIGRGRRGWVSRERRRRRHARLTRLAVAGFAAATALALAGLVAVVRG